MVFCGKRFYNHLKNPPTISVAKRVPWHNDGPTSEVSSISVLIDWMTTYNNYNLWRGGDKQIVSTKTTIANEISKIMKEKGITVERTGKDVNNKINRIVQQF